MHWRYFIFGPGKGLHKMLPMATPYKVHIDPASGCNFRCFFCPQSAPEKLKEAGVVAGVMKFDLFTRLVDGFSEFESKIDQLVFGNYGEPTLNKNLPEMVAYAVKSKTIREVSVISNAELLVPELSKRLVDAGLQKIRISIEALSDEKYLENTDVRVSFDKIVNNIKYLYHWSKLANNQTFVYVKILDIGYITVIYFIIAMFVSRLFEIIFAQYDKYINKSDNYIFIIIEIIIMMWLVGVSTYIVRNLVELIPSPFDGVSGLVHKKVKELGGAGVYTFVIMSFTSCIKDRVTELDNKLRMLF
jgi:MoaA/NifB/PqqE/SkfB family radical SAM enzyme